MAQTAPDDAGSALAAGQAAYQRRDFTAALSLWRGALPALQRSGDPRLGNALLHIGLAYYAQGDKRDALASFRSALDADRASGNRARQADELLDAGIVETDTARYAEALSDLAQAQTLARDLGLKPQQAAIANSTGIALTYLGRYDEALAAERQALALREALGDAPGQADALGAMGVAQMHLSRYVEALATQRQALAIHRRAGNRAGVAQDLGNIGNVLYRLGRYDDALATLQQGLSIARALGNSLGEANDLSSIGAIDLDRGRYAEALATDRQALALYRATGDALGEANELANIGAIEQNLGRYAEALDGYRQALTIVRATGNRLGEATDLANVGNILFALGRGDEALASHRQALALDRALGSRLEEAGELGSIAVLEERLGRYDEALRLHREALAVDAAIDNTPGQADELGSLAVVEEDLGSYATALRDGETALDLHRAAGNRLGEAVNLGNLGIVDEDLKRYADAAKAHRAALAILRALGNRLQEAQELSNLGNVYAETQRLPAALAAYRRALAIDRAIASPRGQADALDDIAYVQRALGRYAAASAATRQAIALYRRLASPDGLWRSLGIEASVAAHLGRRAAAIAGYDAALDAVEGLRAGLSEAERGSFFAGKLFLYDEYIAYLLDLERKAPGRGYDGKALEIFERKTGRAVLEQIGRSAARRFRGVPPEVVAAEAAANDAVARDRESLERLLGAAEADRPATAAAQRTLNDAEARAVGLDATIRQRYPAYYELRHPQPLLARCSRRPCRSIDDFRRFTLRPGEVLLVYALMRARSALWIVERDRLRLIALPGSATIDAGVARLRAHVAGLLSAGSNDAKLERLAAADTPAFASDAFALYRVLVPGVAARALARAASVIVVPSGSLYGLAFETLVTRPPGGAARPHYLIDDAPVSYVPSASLLAVVRAAQSRPDPARAPLLAFANPAFGVASQAQLRSPASVADLQLVAVRSALVRDAAPDLSGAVFPGLPGTQTEADAVRKQLDAPDSSVVSGEDATRAHLLALDADAKLATFRYLLFATHAVLPGEISGVAQPAIVLAHPERGDGLLTMADVFGLSLDADFVALSACNTGVAADDASGEGVSGLTRAFLFAGTPAISVTLWQVDDAAAPRLTPPFFAGMNAGLSPAEALRRAKRAMLAAPQARFRHPYAWAPSVVFGDGDRVGAP